MQKKKRSKHILYVVCCFIILNLLLCSCDSESVMSVVKTTEGQSGTVEKGSISSINTVNSREMFKSELATVNNIENGEVIQSNLNKFDTNYKESAESFVKEFIQFLSNGYGNVDSLQELDKYLGSNISNTERKVFDWWGKNIKQVSETWYIDTVMYNEDNFYINTISRMKRNIDEQLVDVDIAVKWHIKREEDGIKIYSASVVSLDEVSESINSLISNKENMLVYKPSKSIGSEYTNIKSYDTSAKDALIELYKNSCVGVLSDTTEGSGFIIQPGYVLTTYDSVYKAKEINIVFKDKEEIQVDGIVYADKEKNTAVLKLSNKIGTAIDIGDIGELKLGEPIAIIGSAGKEIEQITCGNIYEKDCNEFGNETILARVPLASDGVGSIAVNMNGCVIGIVTGNDKQLKETCKILSIAEIMNTIDIIINSDSNNVNCIKLKDTNWNTSNSMKVEEYQETLDADSICE